MKAPSLSKCNKGVGTERTYPRLPRPAADPGVEQERSRERPEAPAPAESSAQVALLARLSPRQVCSWDPRDWSLRLLPKFSSKVRPRAGQPRLDVMEVMNSTASN